MDRGNKMFEYKIIKLGNPSLRQVSEPIHENEFDSKELHDIVNKLFFAFKKEKAAGLAAPQIGINKRIIVFGVEKHPIYTHVNPVPDTVLINPTIEILTDELEEAYEGCFSVGTLRGKVARAKRIFYRGFDVHGNVIEREAEGLHARVVQHEYDHLDGIVFLDKVTDHLSLGFYDELIESGQLKLRRQPANSE